MPARSAFPLFLLMLVWTLPARVYCQTPEVSLVSTEYVVITWERILQWYGVEDFDVDISSEGISDCHKSVPCTTPTCSFNSLACGLYQPCTATSITVTGGNHTPPALERVTGPEEATDMTVSLEEGVLYISWVNPSNDSSPCYNQTVVNFSFNGEESTHYFDHGIERTSRGLCMGGFGEVEVWTEGGDGQSNSSSQPITYIGYDVVKLVTYESCEPVECTSIEVKWSYTPVCPDVAYINIDLYEVSHNASTDANSLTVTGLEYDREYRTCIKAMRKDGRLLDDDCYHYCSTAYGVAQNLTVQPLSYSALRATWKPPVCQPGPQIQYYLRVDWEDYYTTETTYEVRGLEAFQEYDVKLYVEGSEHYVGVDAYTKLKAPDLYGPYVYQDSIEVSWNVYIGNDWGYEIYYKVTWGKNLSYSDETQNQYYDITGFSDVDEVFQVCVAAAVREREDLTSQTDCGKISHHVTYPPMAGSTGLEGWVIALIVVGLCLVVALLVIGAGLYGKKQSKALNRQRQLQQQQQQQQQQQNHHHHHHQQQQQQQQPLQYMHGTQNLGASL